MELRRWALPAWVIAASVAAGAHALAGGAPPDATRSTRESVLDLHHADFLEGGPGSRPVAALTARLLGGRGTARLVIAASPVGARVQPPAGPEGVWGSNRLTAQEMLACLAGARLDVLATGPSGVVRGRVARGEARVVHERVFLPDGRVERRAVTQDGEVRDVVFEVDVREAGRHEVEVRLDGHVRIHAVVEVGGSGGRIVALESRDPHAGRQP
jgi:hypothetical protein